MAYKPPRIVEEARSANGRSSPMWVIGTTSTEFPKDEQTTAARGHVKAKRRLASRHRYEVDEIRWWGTDSFAEKATREDLVVVIHEGKVFPQARVLHIEKVLSKGKPVHYVYLEARKNPETLRWIAFRSKLQQMGFPRLGKTISAREIKDDLMRRKVQAILPRG